MHHADAERHVPAVSLIEKVSLPSVYRRPALMPPSRKAIGYGTGERLVLHVPMPPSEVVEALSRLVQYDLSKTSAFNTRSHRFFYGTVSASEFRLTPLWSKTTFLSVRGEIRPHDDASMVRVDIRLQLWPLVGGAEVLLLLCVGLVASEWNTQNFVWSLFCVGGLLLVVGLAVLASARGGIASVRRTLLEGLEPGPRAAPPIESVDTANDHPRPRLLEDPADWWLPVEVTEKDFHYFPDRKK